MLRHNFLYGHKLLQQSGKFLQYALQYHLLFLWLPYIQRGPGFVNSFIGVLNVGWRVNDVFDRRISYIKLGFAN